MDRLTKNNREDNKGDYYYPECFEICDGLGTPEKCGECDFCYAVCEKLGKYEDLEEQGRLVILPCKAGDTVYKVNKASRKVARHKVIAVEYEQVVFENYNYCPFNRFGKTVFLTQAEAEQKLKEMESK